MRGQEQSGACQQFNCICLQSKASVASCQLLKCVLFVPESPVQPAGPLPFLTPPTCLPLPASFPNAH